MPAADSAAFARLPFQPPWFLKSGLASTLYFAWVASRRWHHHEPPPQPPYYDQGFVGRDGVPLHGKFAIPDATQTPIKGTVIATYGITGDLEDQWFLGLLGRKAYARNYAVVLFDWRAHGKTAALSPTLTSDGLYEGDDFVELAAQAKGMGCPAPFWFMGFSLGGQLALWGVKAAQSGLPQGDSDCGVSSALTLADIGGAAVICPNLDSNRSLTYLMQHPLGRYVERAIARQLKHLAWNLHTHHPQAIDAAAIQRAQSIRGFDQELVIPTLGFTEVEDYYSASSPLPFLPQLTKPTLILYAADDPMFDPAIIPDLQAACDTNPQVDLVLTQHGGHVAYISSRQGQRLAQDPDPYWAWNRILDWCDRTSQQQDNSYEKSIQTNPG